MFKSIYQNIKVNAVVVASYVNNEKGSLDIFSTKLGLACIAVVVIGIILALAQSETPELFNAFITWMRGKFGF